MQRLRSKVFLAVLLVVSAWTFFLLFYRLNTEADILEVVEKPTPRHSGNTVPNTSPSPSKHAEVTPPSIIQAEISCAPIVNATFSNFHPFYPPQRCKELAAALDKTDSQADPQVSLFCTKRLSGPFVRRNPQAVQAQSLANLCIPAEKRELANIWTDWCQTNYRFHNVSAAEFDIKYNNTQFYPFATDVNVYKVSNALLYSDVIYTKLCRYLPIVHDSVSPFLNEMKIETLPDVVDQYKSVPWQRSSTKHDILHRVMLAPHRWRQNPPPDNAPSYSYKKLVWVWSPWSNHPFHCLYEIIPLVLLMKDQIVNDPDMFVRVPENAPIYNYFYVHLVGIPPEKLLYGYGGTLCCESKVHVQELFVIGEYPAHTIQHPHKDLLKLLVGTICGHVKPIKPLKEQPTRKLEVALIQHGAGISTRHIKSNAIREWCSFKNSAWCNFTEVEDMRNYAIPEQMQLLASFDVLIAPNGSQLMFALCARAGTHVISILTASDLFLYHNFATLGMHFWPLASTSFGSIYANNADLNDDGRTQLFQILEQINSSERG